MSAFVPVVCAVIRRDDLVLVAQRPAHKHLGLKWEFPGGKIEANESPAEALVREIREELGCAIDCLQPLPVFIHHYAAVSIRMFPFIARLAPGSPAPEPHEHVALRWIAPADFPSLDLAEADLPIVAHLAPPRVLAQIS